MAIPNILVDTTFTGKNIATAISVYEYTVAATGTLRVQVRLAAVAGNGDYVCYLTLNDGDAQTDDPILPKTTATAASGETAFWFASISLDAIAGDVLNVFVLGLAGDTNEAGSIRIFSDASLDAAGVRTALGLASANLDTQIAAVQADTDNIQTRLPAALTADGNIKADALKLNGATPNNLSASAVDTQLSSTHGSGLWGGAGGAGASSFVVTVNDGLNPLDGVEVWVTTDSGGSNMVASGVTDAAGEVTFMLDPGSYYLWKQLAGYNFSNPESITVT